MITARLVREWLAVRHDARLDVGGRHPPRVGELGRVDRNRVGLRGAIGKSEWVSMAIHRMRARTVEWANRLAMTVAFILTRT